jgi:1-acyl-sn-glycerol-3-phosphate acyltransferase
VIALRSGVFLLLLSLSVVLFGVPIILLGRLIPFRWLTWIARSWGRSVLALLSATCGLRYQLRGLENVPPASAIVFCKHQSAWETIALRALLPPAQTWVLKRELIRVPIFGWALAAFQPIAIDRSAGRRSVKQLLTQGQAALDQGRIVIIFPEGTRVSPGERRPYGIGGAVLAERSGRPVVPVAHNAGVFWGRRGFLKHPGVVELVIGAPIQCQGRRAEDIRRDAEEWIESVVAQLPAKP